jgi:YgiT-type zinc finger domain-containing protein
MICVICRQAQLENTFTSINFERGELKFLINRVPAHVCPFCGEAYVDEDVATQLLENTEELARAGIMDVVRGYEE